MYQHTGRQRGVEGNTGEQKTRVEQARCALTRYA
jgi:hypothetical protein